MFLIYKVGSGFVVGLYMVFIFYVEYYWFIVVFFVFLLFDILYKQFIYIVDRFIVCYNDSYFVYICCFINIQFMIVLLDQLIEVQCFVIKVRIVKVIV